MLPRQASFSGSAAPPTSLPWSPNISIALQVSRLACSIAVLRTLTNAQALHSTTIPQEDLLLQSVATLGHIVQSRQYLIAYVTEFLVQVAQEIINRFGEAVGCLLRGGRGLCRGVELSRGVGL